MTKENKDLEYYRKNAEEDYLTTPISVLRYISELEAAVKWMDNERLKDQNYGCYGCKHFDNCGIRMDYGNGGCDEKE
jgi:hypothetical protein